MVQFRSRTSRNSSAAPIQNQEAPEESFAIRVMTPFRPAGMIRVYTELNLAGLYSRI